MEDPRIISALFIFLKMAYYNVLINTLHKPPDPADCEKLTAGSQTWTHRLSILPLSGTLPCLPASERTRMDELSSTHRRRTDPFPNIAPLFML